MIVRGAVAGALAVTGAVLVAYGTVSAARWRAVANHRRPYWLPGAAAPPYERLPVNDGQRPAFRDRQPE